MPSVTSGSSPASFLTAQRAISPSQAPSSSSVSTRQPLGVSRAMLSGSTPPSSSSAAPEAASAAQVPVV